MSLIAVLSFIFSFAQNAIVTENALPGNPSSEWDISGVGDLSIQGFATDISVNKGETVHFKIKTDASAYTIRIYRLGYYAGKGARFVGNGTITASLPQTQPSSPNSDPATGLIDCSNWSESAHWDVPSSAVSGIYIAKLTRTDDGGSSHIIFIVRDDGGNADLLFQTSDATWQAYNVYGGNSLYVGATSFSNGHAAKVSYNRPFITRIGGGGGGAMEDWVFNAEYPMIRFLEKNGYNVSYFTNVDAARHGNLILNHKVFMSVGHDEYWSAEQRANVEAARNAGVHLAFFSGNEVYWKTRWENNFRTLVCYKEGTLGENVCGEECDPHAEWTGLWRDGCGATNGAGGCNPENALTGQISWAESHDQITVPDTYKNYRFWRNTSVALLGANQTKLLPMGTLGYEWNFEQYAASNPHGRMTLSSTTIGDKTHKLSLYRHASGALVFGAGTVQWTWGLDSVHDRGNEPVSRDMQQATVNLFADMGVQPATLQGNLVPATQSTDFTAPTVTISSPANGASFPAAKPFTINGTITDANTVAGVEISVDGGITWKPASGNYNWSYTWIPPSSGTVTIKVRGFDDSGNMSVPGSAPSADAITLNITAPQCPCTIFQPTDEPAETVITNGTAVELGVKFKTNVNGFIKGLRFFKSPNGTGTHTGSLWLLNGTMLAQAAFVNETASGWQELQFANPVPVTAGTIYIASYHSPSGYYSETSPYFTDSVVNGPLIALADDDPDMTNGVYKFTDSPSFPDMNYSSDNYFVDVVFDTNPADVTAPEITTTSPADFAHNINVNASFQATFSETIKPETVNAANIELKNAFAQVVPASVTYNAGLHKVILTPSSPLNYSSTYTVTIKGGTSGILDLAGNPLPGNVTKTFTTADAVTIAPGDGPGGPILVVYANANPFSRYAAEILRAEGLNAFATAEIASVTAAMLNDYDVVILGEMPVTAAQVTLLSDWVNAGGTFIAFRPHASLLPLLGVSPASGTLSNKYLLVNTASGPGVGIVNQTIQFHGTANLHALNGASSLATFYADAATPTTYPAVTTINVGSNGGKAVAFLYDLPSSIVYTRQGNPAWIGQKRDGTDGPVRSDDLFFGNDISNPEPDWIDFNKIDIPQADEQQRLLANIILQHNLHRKPLPRFWYLPRNLKAAIVMTGDDHSNNGTVSRFNHYLTLGPNSPMDVANWNAIRGTSYIYPGTAVTNAQAMAFEAQGFEIALHATTNCTNFTQASLASALTTQAGMLASQLPGLSVSLTNRTHCMPWSDWASHAKAEAQTGIRLDVNYYYWPDTWVQNRPGMFTGSGMPMRFADIDGTIIDCYQAVTQMTDESGIEIGNFTNAVLDKALGAEGYYGVFTTNMHTDTGANHAGSQAIINAAMARQVPVISAKQLLTWLDGRNNSSFSSIVWTGNVLNFTITAASGSNNLRAMLPTHSDSGVLTQITRVGIPVSYTVAAIKGIEYAFFDASVTGSYSATYGPTTTIMGTVTLQGRAASPDAAWIVPIQVELYVTGNPAAVATFTTTTDASGHFTVSGVAPGTYNIKVKSSHTLARVKTGQTLVIGSNAIDFDVLLEGDVNNDNFVDGLDASLLLNSFYLATGDPGFNAMADLNGDGFVDGLDASLLLNNFYQLGEEP